MYLQTMPKQSDEIKPAEVALKEAGLNETLWGRRILDAKRRGCFSDEDASDSGSWVSCACGRNTLIRFHCTPNGSRLEPVDSILKVLGLGFTEVVVNDLFDDAADLLIKIEKRAGDVHRESILTS